MKLLLVAIVAASLATAAPLTPPTVAAPCVNADLEDCDMVGVPFRTLNPPNGYDDPATLMAYFEAAAADNSDIVELIDLNALYGTNLTHNGQRIYAVKISDNVGTDEDEPNQLFVANHHSRELITPQLARNTTEELIARYRAGDADVTYIVETYQTYVMWTMNPDGLEHVWNVDNMWRKNRRNNGGSYGVDLNRNYPPCWDCSCGGSPTQSSCTYRGPAPASEPETQTMIAFQRDRNFAKLLDWHSYARDTRPGYGECGQRDSRMTAMWNDVGRDLADQMTGYRLGSSCCMAGDIHNAFDQQGSMSVLIESGTAFQPSEAAMREELARVWPGTLWYALMPIPVLGHVRDTQGNPREAGFAVAGLTYHYNEPANWSSAAATGRYHLWLPDGTFAVTASAPGCAPQTIDVTSDPMNSENVVNFVLSC